MSFNCRGAGILGLPPRVLFHLASLIGKSLSNPATSKAVCSFFLLLVGAPGFEPGVICSQNRHVSRYTTPRLNHQPKLVGLPGIEPGPHPPHGCILPLYYSPCSVRLYTFGVPGIEPGSHEPESCILPLYYTPWRDLL